jgi:putative RNA 2'-phosphotransferase
MCYNAAEKRTEIMTFEEQQEQDVTGLTSVSRLLSKILRHEPDLVGVKLDAQGWVDVDVLLSAIARAGRKRGAEKRLRKMPEVSRELLEQVVANNDKQRFSFSEDGKRIRAVQGHSVEIELGHEVVEPPPVLYHGTATRFLAAILSEGLDKRSRHAVHLSATVETAINVGSRHGRPVVLVVDAAAMHHAGFAFSRSDNGVWLVDSVPPQFLRQRG